MSVFNWRQICKMAGSKDRSRKRTSGIFFIGKKIPKILVASSSPTHTDTDTVGHASRRRCSTQHVFHSFNSQTYLHIWESGMHFGYLVVCWSLYCAWISNRTVLSEHDVQAVRDVHLLVHEGFVGWLMRKCPLPRPPRCLTPCQCPPPHPPRFCWLVDKGFAECHLT